MQLGLPRPRADNPVRLRISSPLLPEYHHRRMSPDEDAVAGWHRLDCGTVPATDSMRSLI